MWLFKAHLQGTFAVIFFSLIFIPALSFAGSAVDIPMESGVYQDLEFLELKGLIPGAILSTRPFSRAEGARLVKEAESNWELLSEREKAGRSVAGGIIRRLGEEFRTELSDRRGAATFLKPVGNAYIKNLYASDTTHFSSINNNGDEFKEGYNLRAGFALEGGLLDAFSFYFNPEYRLGEDGSRGAVLKGYVKLDIAGLEIEAGRDSMWWGPGFHGDLIMTNNAPPFDMVKATSRHPFLLPWIFSYLGPFKPTIFLTRLEQDRDFSRANLLGMRLDFKPTARFRFALSRVILFGGHGRKSLDFSDWMKVFFASDSAEHMDSPINGDQIVSVDASYVYVNDLRAIPFSGIKLYTEVGAEDSSGVTRSPTTKAYLFGFLVDEPFWLKNIDFRAEYATTARSDKHPFAQWYRHPVYTTGYTYEGRVIGHHMGSDAKDLFIRFQYHHPRGATIGVESDMERGPVHEANTVKRSWYGVDATYPSGAGFMLSASVGMEQTNDPACPGRQSDTTAWFGLEKRF